jgi:hypothetical protein
MRSLRRRIVGVAVGVATLGGVALVAAPGAHASSQVPVVTPSQSYPLCVWDVTINQSVCIRVPFS